MNPSGKSGLWLIIELAIILGQELIEAFKDHLQRKRRK
jgi:hypothetical protein